jgi:xanthine/CO dehydrogenase XdhC/CoxF family maturation factor
MNQLQAILEAFELSQKSGETAFLATVVNTQGSTYRQPGARMLITPTRMVGAISGGCLEQDICEQLQQRSHGDQSIQDEPFVITYDTTDDEEIVWGLGLGCNGVVQVLIQRLDVNRDRRLMTFWQACLHSQKPGVLATVFNVEGTVDVEIGARFMLYPDGRVNTDIKALNFGEAIACDAEAAKNTQQSTVHRYQGSSGNAAVLIEVIQPPIHLVIFGAGYDAIPVAQFAKALGWQVTVVDCRANAATKERFTMADEVILTRPEKLQKQGLIHPCSVAVVMTHHYLDDLEILRFVLSSNARYLGVLGSKHRTERLLQDIGKDNAINPAAQLQNLHSPIGIDIGADTPEEIAIAIIAEIKAVLANRNGGLLRNRTESIHSRHEVKTTQIKQYHPLHR